MCGSTLGGRAKRGNACTGRLTSLARSSAPRSSRCRPGPGGTNGAHICAASFGPRPRDMSRRTARSRRPSSPPFSSATGRDWKTTSCVGCSGRGPITSLRSQEEMSRSWRVSARVSLAGPSVRHAPDSWRRWRWSSCMDGSWAAARRWIARWSRPASISPSRWSDWRPTPSASSASSPS